MCHDEKSSTALYQIKEPIDVVLGDGHSLTATGRGKVHGFRNGYQMVSQLQSLICYMMFSICQNLLISVTKASQTGKVVKFTKSACYTIDRNHN